MQIPVDDDHQSSNLNFNGFSGRVEAYSLEIITTDPFFANTPAPGTLILPWGRATPRAHGGAAGRA